MSAWLLIAYERFEELDDHRRSPSGLGPAVADAAKAGAPQGADEEASGRTRASGPTPHRSRGRSCNRRPADTCPRRRAARSVQRARPRQHARGREGTPLGGTGPMATVVRRQPASDAPTHGRATAVRRCRRCADREGRPPLLANTRVDAVVRRRAVRRRRSAAVASKSATGRGERASSVARTRETHPRNRENHPSSKPHLTRHFMGLEGGAATSLRRRPIFALRSQAP